MASIRFKGKVRDMRNMDGSLAYRYIEVPMFKKSHCDMHAFRTHPKYGGLANSDLFPGVLARIRQGIAKNGKWMRIGDIPPDGVGVTVDTRGFLAVVVVEV